MRAGVLFEVAIDHDYRLNVGEVAYEVLPDARQTTIRRAANEASFLNVWPLPETLARMAGHGMIFKTRPGGFLVGVELEGTTNQPKRPFTAGSLRFALEISDSAFRDHSGGLGDGFHLFGNAVGSERAGMLFLSRPVATFSTTRAYRAGDLRAAPSGPVTPLFQALRDTGPSGTPVVADWRSVPVDTHDPAASYATGARVLSGAVLFEAAIDNPGADLTDATEWTELGPLPNQYATADDEVVLRPDIFNIDVSSAAAPVLELRAFRQGETVPVRRTIFNQTGSLATIQADLRGLADGPYRTEVADPATGPVAGLGQDFYLSPGAVAGGWFGLIEIVPGTGNFALLDGSQNLRSPRFNIRFASQAARLRFRFPTTQPVGAGAQVAPEAGDDSILVTPDPLPLTRRGEGVLLRADDLATPAVSEAIRLPHHTHPALSKQGGQWFSDLHLSNLPPLT